MEKKSGKGRGKIKQKALGGRKREWNGERDLWDCRELIKDDFETRDDIRCPQLRFYSRKDEENQKEIVLRKALWLPMGELTMQNMYRLEEIGI